MKFQSVFGPHTVVLPVIHIEKADKALQNIQIAVDAGAPGVFLITHQWDWIMCWQTFVTARAKFPHLWIGVNFLTKAPFAMNIAAGRGGQARLSGLWVDNAQISEHTENQPRPERTRTLQEASSWDGLYFGGVAFKYQAAVTDVAQAARFAYPYVDVVTTSGPATGEPADPAKLHRMKHALPKGTPLAVASGVSIDNVDIIAPYVDAILVASSISDEWDALNPAKTRALIDRVASLQS